MKQVLVKPEGVVVEDVPAPLASEKSVLVRVAYSCISAGTELAGVESAKMPIYRRAAAQPENVRRVMDMVSDQGLRRTVDRVRGRLAAGSATGYSAAGTVAGLGDGAEGFAPGDRVACAGAGIANHAEFIDVPVKLAVRVPRELDLRAASTVTLGAIALQGVRRANLTLGETVVVVGMGVLGNLTARLAKVNGCTVIAVDLSRTRLQMAVDAGVDEVIDPSQEDWPAQVHRLTAGYGADAAIITAATESHELLSQAFRACRKKARAVLVGDVGLNLRRSDIYEKELDFLVSTSYGPGRYDPTYEKFGRDYPLAYVRWTENRNMEAYLHLLSGSRVSVDDILAEPVDIDDAPSAYDRLLDEERRDLISVLKYPQALAASVEPRRVDTPDRLVRRAGRGSPLNVGIIGAGGFAQGVHLPNLAKLGKEFNLRAVASRTGANAKATAERYGARYATTDPEQLFADDSLDVVMIFTRHDSHGSLVMRSLEAGKNVFVEKPLSLDPGDLDAIEAFYRSRNGSSAPLLMTGFNRRFSPAMRAVRELTSARGSAFVASYRMNAGFVPAEHWVQGPEGGGRNLGEACHIYDTFRYLTGTEVSAVTATPVSTTSASGAWLPTDNFVATLTYACGSLCTLTYTSMGTSSYPKERADFFVDGKIAELDDYREVRISGGHHQGWQSRTQEKGQAEELSVLAEALHGRRGWPIPLAEQLETSRVALRVDGMIRGQQSLP